MKKKFEKYNKRKKKKYLKKVAMKIKSQSLVVAKEWEESLNDGLESL